MIMAGAAGCDGGSGSDDGTNGGPGAERSGAGSVGCESGAGIEGGASDKSGSGGESGGFEGGGGDGGGGEGGGGEGGGGEGGGGEGGDRAQVSETPPTMSEVPSKYRQSFASVGQAALLSSPDLRPYAKEEGSEPTSQSASRGAKKR